MANNEAFSRVVIQSQQSAATPKATFDALLARAFSR